MHQLVALGQLQAWANVSATLIDSLRCFSVHPFMLINNILTASHSSAQTRLAIAYFVSNALSYLIVSCNPCLMGERTRNGLCMYSVNMIYVANSKEGYLRGCL